MCDIKKLIADERANNWWNELENNKSNIKWTVMQHNGVYFPPEYEPLPDNIKVLYKNKPVSLSKTDTDNKFNITAEEAAVFLAQKMEQDDRLSEKNKNRKKSIDDKKFVENFWNDWKEILGPNHKIKEFDKVDFSPIQEYIVKRSQEKKAIQKSKSKEEKQESKQEKEEIKDLYGYAVIDGVKIPIGNYTIQPPGLYIGHGNQPLRGKIKKRMEPRDITLNISKQFVPKCFIHSKPCKWGKTVEDRTVTWIASYRHPITDELIYIWLKREESAWVCVDDKIKFDKARTLDKSIEKIRKKYMKDLESSSSEVRQLSTAVYLLDVLAIRPGTEKDETKEAGTLGLTTLKCANISFEGDDQININFTGKSSIVFEKTFSVIPIVYKNLKKLCKNASDNKEIFSNVNATSLNNYLKSLLPDLTAKVFRTWKASSILYERLFENIPSEDLPVHEKKIIYDKVNIEVAKELNHKKLGGSDERIEKLKQKIKDLKEKKKSASTEKQKETAKKSIDVHKTKLEEALGNISTATSKQNYLDPRISVAWCKACDMPIEKIYNKTQLQKFIWAMDIPSTWKF